MDVFVKYTELPKSESRIASIPTRADRHGYARLNAIDCES